MRESDSRAVVLSSTPRGDYLAPADDLITKHLQRYGGHTRPHIALLRSVLGSESFVFDVGAHVGSFTVPLGLRVVGGGRIWCFEPDPQSHSLLELNIVLNGLENTATAIRAAVSDSVSPVFMAHPEDENTGANYIVAESADSGEPPLPVVVIDEFVEHEDIARLDLLKIDVEGMETAVLNGASKVIERHRPYLFFEVSRSQLERFGSSPGQIDRFFADSGYVFFLPEGPRNEASDHFTLRPVEVLDDVDEVLFDVLAAPQGRDHPALMSGEEP